MRTEAGRGRGGFLAASLLSAAAAATHGAWAAEEVSGGAEATAGFGADWQSWHAANDVSDMASVQRGARNFVSYCLGCHSLKYERWSRLGQDQRSYLRDRKSTRLNSSHEWSSYAVFCLKKK